MKDKILNKFEKYIQGLYAENVKTLMKDIKGDVNKWRDILNLWNGTQNKVKMSNWI